MRFQGFLPVIRVTVVGVVELRSDTIAIGPEIFVDRAGIAAGTRIIVCQQHFLAELQIDQLRGVGGNPIDVLLVVQGFLQHRGATVVAGRTIGNQLGIGIGLDVVIGFHIHAAAGGNFFATDGAGIVDQRLCRAADLVGRQDDADTLTGSIDDCRGRRYRGVGNRGVQQFAGVGQHRNIAAGIDVGSQDLGNRVGRVLAVQGAGNQRIAEQGIDHVEQQVGGLPADRVEGQDHADPGITGRGV